MTLLLDKTFRLSEKDWKTHFKIPFEVPESTKELSVLIEYSPKENNDAEFCANLTYKYMIEQAGEELFSPAQLRVYYPLKNHISFSLDSPRGWRGTAHRGDKKQQYVLKKDFASQGFFEGEIDCGQWFLTASVNSIVTKFIDLQVRIEAV